MQPRIIVIGYTNKDINITPIKTTTLPGGAAYFTAIAASLLTSSVGLVTRIGTDFDASFLMKRVNPDGIKIIKNKHTAKSIQTYHSATDFTDRDISLEWGVAPDICPGDIPSAWFATAEYVHIGTMPPKQQATFIPYIRNHMPQAIISIDSDKYLLSEKHNISLVSKNFLASDIIFVSRKEYEILEPIVLKHPYAVVKVDADGAKILKYGHEIYSCKANRVIPVDVTGAGDILAGSYIASLSIGKSEEESLQMSVDLATQSIVQEGVMHLFR